MATVPNGIQFSLAVGNQTSEGTPAATYLFDLPIWSGNIAPKTTVNPFDVADTTSFHPGYFIQEAHWESQSLQVGAFPTSLPFFYNLLFGTDTVGGSAPANTHTISNATLNSLWGTFWIKRPTISPTSLTDQFEDGSVTGVELVVAAGQPLKVNLDLIGKTVTTAATYPSAIASTAGAGFAGLTEAYSSRNAIQTVTSASSAQTTNTVTITKAAHPFVVGDIVTVSGSSVATQNGTFNVATVPSTSTFTYTCPTSSSSGGGSSITVSSNSYLSAIGSTLKMDSATSPASSTVTNVESASIKVMRNTTMTQTGTLTPATRTLGLYSISLSATVVMDAQAAFNYYRVANFGSASGTTLSPIVVPGGLDFTFFEGPVAGGNKFRLSIPAIVYDMEPHAFDNSGGPVKFTVTGMVDKYTGSTGPGSGSIQPIGTNGSGAYPTS